MVDAVGLQNPLKRLCQNSPGQLNSRVINQGRCVDRIALLHLGGLGDYMMFIPVIKVFRSYFPQAHITLMATPNIKALMPILPEVDSFCIIDGDNKGFWSLLKQFRDGQFDILIVGYEFFLSKTAMSLALGLSDIPVRVGCARNSLREWVLTVSRPDNAHHPNLHLMDDFFNLAEICFRVLGEALEVRPMDLYHHTILTEDQQRAMEILAVNEPPMTCCRFLIHPGTSKMSKVDNWLKSWPPGQWAGLIHQMLLTYPMAVVYLTGGPEDREEIEDIMGHLACLPEIIRNQIVNLYDANLPVATLAALMGSCDVFIGCDSFAMHLALYVGTPSVALFGSTNERRFLPDPSTCLVAARDDLYCRPCLNITRTSNCADPVCLDIPIDTVIEKIKLHLHDQISDELNQALKL